MVVNVFSHAAKEEEAIASKWHGIPSGRIGKGRRPPRGTRAAEDRKASRKTFLWHDSKS